MRATKGLWAAVGAGTSLAAAALLVLVSVSVVLAVHGWPQVSSADDSNPVALRAAPIASGASSAAAQAPSPVVLASRAARVTSHRGGRVGHRTVQRPGGVGAIPTGSTTAPAPSPAAGSVAPVTHTVGSTVTSVTDTAGGALDPVSPSIAHTVTSTGQQAGNAIDQVGKTVGGIVGGVTGGR
jgi:hypothetical protein